MLIIVTIIPVSAAEISDVNPELTAITMDSSSETLDGSAYYQPVTEFSQGDGKYTLSSNSYVAWYREDDISFAYKQYNVSQDSNSDDYLNAQVTIDAPLSASSVLPANASMGLMIRSGLGLDSSNIFLHIRQGSSVCCVYRTNTGDFTSVQYTNVDITFPCVLRIEIKGYIATLYYKSASAANFNKFTYPIAMRGSGPLYVGLAAHSVSQSVMATAKFSDLKVEGYGTYDPSADPSSSSSNSSSSEEYVEEDPPIPSDTIYKETFSKNDLNTVTGSNDNGEIINEDGNRIWYKNLVDGENFFGDSAWTDYEVSTKLLFTENCNPDPKSMSNTFRLFARSKAVEFYGMTGYYAQISEGYKISLYKRNFTKKGVENGGTLVSDIVSLRTLYDDDNYNCLGDGKWHTLKLKVFDNKITVSWDNTDVINWEDDGKTVLGGEGYAGDFVFGTGRIGVATLQTSVYIDDITVVKIEDDFGGDYDNKIGGKWDDPIPSYVSDWEYK